MQLKSFMLVLLFMCIILVTAGKEENDIIQCPSECGLYNTDDKMGPHFHQQCDAFDKKCSQMRNIIEDQRKLRKKFKRNSGVRVVGGQVAKHPMPWMALMTWDDSLCGGALINSQWIVTAAHCPCQNGFCTRGMGKVGKDSLRIKDDVNIKERVGAYLGATEVYDGVMKWTAMKLFFEKPKSKLFKVESVYIHPKLGTDEEHKMNPDIALIKLSTIVNEFSNEVRPICLAKPYPEGKQTCPDSSVEKVLDKKLKKKWKITKEPSSMLGGCASVAGWGFKYDSDIYMDDSQTCTTDNSNIAPTRNKPCAEWWQASGKEYYTCTKVNMKPDDLHRGCEQLFKELMFQKMIKSGRYKDLNLNEMVDKFQAPVEIVLGKKVFHCSKTDFSKERRNKDWNGWCATERTKKDKIQMWGMCSDTCKNDSHAFTHANMNLLTEDECTTLAKYQEMDLGINFKTEICAGKKSNFPNAYVAFQRKKKTKKKIEEDKALAKKANVNVEPTKYWWKVQDKPQKKSLDLPNGYPYNWFIGGVDTCQGDSGGPLWTNIKEDGKVRATILGVVSRGAGCAAFNAPAIYGSVSKNYGWIQEIVLKESKDTDKLCPGGSKSKSKKGKSKKRKRSKKSKKGKRKHHHYKNKGKDYMELFNHNYGNSMAYVKRS